MNSRLAVLKTYKLYIGGKFVRAESGRVVSATSSRGDHLANVGLASRKDFRDAVVAARKAFDGWASTTAYLRGQILYRAAEMLQGRAGELGEEIQRSTGVSRATARREVTASIDRLVHFAGWTDKISQVFGAVNPVATPHFNFTVPEPTGVVAVLAPDQPSLLALVSLLGPVILTGNTAVAVVSERFPLPASTFAEVLATSDLPGGVVNLLTGRRADLVPTMATHMDINAVVDGVGVQGQRRTLEAGGAANLKRYAGLALPAAAWFRAAAQDPERILATVEFKTVWHPMGY